jgi:hypothetical protein
MPETDGTTKMLINILVGILKESNKSTWTVLKWILKK